MIHVSLTSEAFVSSSVSAPFHPCFRMPQMAQKSKLKRPAARQPAAKVKTNGYKKAVNAKFKKMHLAYSSAQKRTEEPALDQQSVPMREFNKSLSK